MREKKAKEMEGENKIEKIMEGENGENVRDDRKI